MQKPLSPGRCDSAAGDCWSIPDASIVTSRRSHRGCHRQRCGRAFAEAFPENGDQFRLEESSFEVQFRRAEAEFREGGPMLSRLRRRDETDRRGKLGSGGGEQGRKNTAGDVERM